MTSPNPYNPRTRARALARPFAVRRKNHVLIQTLQLNIVTMFRSHLSQVLHLHPDCLMAIPRPKFIKRSWVGQRYDQNRGYIHGLPQLQIPLLSQDRSYSCLWLYLQPGSKIMAARQRALAQFLARLGHRVDQVRNLEEAHASILAYFGAD